MKLEDFANELVADNNFIKMCFGGFAGSGKSRTATEILVGLYKKMKYNKPVLFIDNEKGSRFLIPFFKKANIPVLVKETTKLQDVIESFEFLEKGELSAVFIDSLTKVWYRYVNEYKEKNRRVFMTLQDWGKILPAWQEAFANPFVECKETILFTGRGGYTYDVEENDETKKKEFIKSGIKMKMAGETPFEPDVNIWMEYCQEIVEGKPVVWREGLVLKDRSSLIDGKTFKNPTFKDVEPVIDYLLTTPKGEIKKETFTENIAPCENYDAIERRERKSIELEKIKNIFDKYGFGTSKEDKQLKVIVCEKVFGTSSGTEIEKKQLSQLTECRVKLEELLSEWNQMNKNNEIILNYKN